MPCCDAFNASLIPTEARTKEIQVPDRPWWPVWLTPKAIHPVMRRSNTDGSLPYLEPRGTGKITGRVGLARLSRCSGTRNYSDTHFASHQPFTSNLLRSNLNLGRLQPLRKKTRVQSMTDQGLLRKTQGSGLVEVENYHHVVL